MFTGIVQKTTTILSVTPQNKCLVMRFKKPRWHLKLGQSIMVDGICSTVTHIGNGFFEVVYMPETLKKTTAGKWQKGSVVNLERSLTLRDAIDGHLVSGHVDGEARVIRVAQKGQSREITFSVPERLSRYIATKGSLAINGVSLTIAKETKQTVTVALIPYTLGHTNLGLLVSGDHVNVEVDMAARYIEKFQRSR